MSKRSSRLWPAFAAAASVAAVTAAAVFNATHDRVSLNPIAASTSMPQQQAEIVAQSTVRLWAQEVRAGHRANTTALACTGSRGDSPEAQRLAAVGKLGTPIEILGFSEFAENDPSHWSMMVFFFWPGGSDTAKVFHFAVEDDELRLCDITAPPTLQ
ncbi:hypothetical protein [Mycolicibacterium conceptionense]|uniref:hypothetical protein n=1 Tax=Mycolicibacterium conceptionense TaxID=451644 RepID=UPI0007EDBDE9|nr:hypothetical protein [Mycolicibacterium conceptionense]OBK04644.1 hypothetical protein A5639_20395 [Mycolicibacterium conceptionense]